VFTLAMIVASSFVLRFIDTCCAYPHQGLSRPPLPQGEDGGEGRWSNADPDLGIAAVTVG